MRIYILLFVLNHLNPDCILHWQQVSVWTAHISSSQQQHVASGYSEFLFNYIMPLYPELVTIFVFRMWITLWTHTALQQKYDGTKI